MATYRLTEIFVGFRVSLLWKLNLLVALTLSVTLTWSLDNGATYTNASVRASDSGSPLIGFSNNSGEFANILPMGEAPRQVEVSIKGSAGDSVDTVQLLLNHTQNISIISAVCLGDFFGGFSPRTPVEITPYRVAVVCASSDAVEVDDGVVVAVTIERLDNDIGLIEIITDGPFGTRLYSAGTPISLEPVDSLLIVDQHPPADPNMPRSSGTPTPTASPQVPPTVEPSRPDPPGAIKAVAGNAFAEVSWEPPADDGGSPIISYTIRSSNHEISLVVPSTERSLRIGGLENGRDYRFRIRATNAIDDGLFSAYTDPVTPIGPPGAPRDVNAEPVPDTASVVVSWSAPENLKAGPVEGYEISEGTGQLSPVRVPSSTESHTFRGLSQGTYLFLVQALGSEGKGPFASANQVTIEDIPNSQAASPVPATPTPVVPTPEPTPVQPLPSLTMSEIEAQLSSALGQVVVLEDGPPDVHVRNGQLRAEMKVVNADSSQIANFEKTDFSGFQLGDLTVTGFQNRPTKAVVRISHNTVIYGDAILVTSSDAVAIELRKLLLVYSPTIPAISDEATTLTSISFELDVASIANIPDFETEFLESAEIDGLFEKLNSSEQRASGVRPASHQVLGALRVEHDDELLLSALETRLSFSFIEVSEPGSLEALKIDDHGEVHIRPVTCSNRESGRTNCSVTFNDEAAGFSTFVIYEVANSSESTRQSADGGISLTSTPSAAIEESPQPVSTLALPTPGPIPTVPAFLASDTEPTNSIEDSPGMRSAIVLISLGAIAVIVVTGVLTFAAGRYSASRKPLVILLVLLSSIVLLSADLNTSQSRLHALGKVLTEGDVAQGSDVVKSRYGVRGDGITIGVISNSLSCDLLEFQSVVGTNDLPDGVRQQADLPAEFCPPEPSIDRGNQIGQIIYDVAPEADIVFISSLLPDTTLSESIRNLAAGGVDIIIDDAIEEPPGEAKTGAISEAIAAGVIYIESARDSGNSDLAIVVGAANFTESNSSESHEVEAISVLNSYELEPDLLGPSGIHINGSSGPRLAHGSSVAAAHIAGATALLIEIRPDLRNSGALGHEEIRWLLRNFTSNVEDDGEAKQIASIPVAAARLEAALSTAMPDAYLVGKNSVLSVASNGILANDTTTNNAERSVTLASGPAYGSLELSQDGSFVYVPDQDFIGEDHFTYIATINGISSLPIGVWITVTNSKGIVAHVELQGVERLTDFGSDTPVAMLSNGEKDAAFFFEAGGSGHIAFSHLTPGTFSLSVTVPGFLEVVADGINPANFESVIELAEIELPAGDVNSDSRIDLNDALLLVSAFGDIHETAQRRDGDGNVIDMDSDGVTNGKDLSLTVSNIGLTGPISWPD